MDPYYGYGTKAKFEAAIQAQLDEMSLADRGGRDRQPEPQRQARPPDRKDVISGPLRGEERHGISLKGAPGSPERMKQLKQLYPDVAADLESQQHAESIGQMLDSWYQSDDGDFDNTVPVQIAQAALDSHDMRVVMAARAAVEDIGGEESVEVFDQRLNAHVLALDEQARQEFAASEDRRMAEMERGLTEEYSRISDKLGPAGLQAGAEVAEALDMHGLLYDPLADPEQTRDMIRASAEAGRAQEYSHNVLTTHMALDQEIKRKYGPGGVPDDVRARWEAEVDGATVQAYQRAAALGEPDLAAARAIADRNEEAQKVSSFESQLDAAIDDMRTHDSTAPHRQEIARKAAEHWEQTRDERGAPRQ